MKAEEAYLGPKTTKQAFTHRDTHPLILNLLMISKFGPDCLAWEPETCWHEIRSTWGGSVSELNKNKIQAVRTAHLSDSPYERWEIFDLVCAGLVGSSPRFDLIQKPSPHRAAFAIDVLSQIKENARVSDEVLKYCGASMLDYGMVYGPGSLEPCNKFIRPFVGSAQERVQRAYSSGAKPLFDGQNTDDVQLMKSYSVRDFQESTSRMLLSQLKRLIP
tara:strand:+ start:4380 stop:5033 length:654 start_codon:yes stop_codon:yes gene_type:complete